MINLNDNVVYKKYINTIKGYKRISCEREKQLSKIIQSNQDKKLVAEAEHEFITSNLFLSVKQANLYCKNNHLALSRMDLISVGNMAIAKAVKKYDANHVSNAKFSTYAIPTINREMNRAIRKNKFIVKPNRHYIYKSKMLELEAKYGTNLTDDMILNDLRMTPGLLSLIKQSDKSNILYLEEINFATGKAEEECGKYMWEDVVPNKSVENPCQILCEKSLKNFINKYIKELPERSQNVLNDIYNTSSPSLNDLAKKYNLSRERIRQIKVRSLKKIRKRIINDLKLKYGFGMDINVNDRACLKTIIADIL